MSLTPTYVGLAAANLAAWLWAYAAFADRPALLAMALLAYVFGLRHAVDADHIAAIDNVVRKLVQENKRAEHVGLYFSLGHATVVVLATAVVASAATHFQELLAEVARIGAFVGAATSATFLLLVGVLNLVVLRGIWRAFVRAQRGEPLEPGFAPGGLLSRIFGGTFGAIGRAAHMYPLGFLFGLGFDTATEVGLLGMSASSAAGGLRVHEVMIFPALFTAGMALVDTTDSILMVRAYRWAFVRPARKLWYNLTMTGASVAVALGLGGVEALHLVAEKLELDGPFWRTVQGVNESLASLGAVVVALFMGSWLVSVAIYRWKRFDDLAATTQS
ncbi:MAG TPA: HoxN/HupN/NixA family nickel/cobalt transporter [Myxococcota bacterium]|nr:HoxN/HupN/NixA family nickel/cobalt transporter [Myxococcota bacterium]